MRIAFIGSGHWAPMELAKSVSSDIYILKYAHHNILLKYLSILKAFFLAFKIPKHDVYIVDGEISLFFAVFKKIFRRENCKIIVRVNNALFSYNEFNRYKKFLVNFLIKYIDGVIAVSHLVDEDVKKNFKIPTRIAYSFLRDEKFFKIKPDFKSKNIIGGVLSSNMRTGTDILVDSYRLAKKNKDIGKLFILGYRFVREDFVEKNSSEDIKFVGFVDPKKYMSKGAFFVHPARFEPGPNIVIEAMATGLVPIVSYKTGHKYIVEQVSKELVVYSLNPEDYARVILKLSKSRKKLERLSKKCREISKNYTFEKQSKKFEKAVFELIREIN